ncbi:MAG: hypothetical protein HUU30_20835, partial [Burkholderiaceae bacterium]|nr:hypothetical protein [Burkholderiaceae bacterium]
GLPVDAVLCAATAAPRRHFGMPQPLLGVGAAWEAVALDVSPFAATSLGHALQRVAQVWLAPGARA